MKPVTIICISVPLLILGSCAVMFTSWVREVERPPESGENVESVDWLPAEATNISYYRSYGFTAYEFRISEAGFRKWAPSVAYKAGSDHVSYQPLTEVADLEEKDSAVVERYNRFNGRVKDLAEGATLKEIKNGLWGEARRGSAGGYSIGYDRDTGTAYWQSNPR